MYLSDLFEAESHRKTIVIFPGRFNLFTKAHKAVYDYLSQKFNAEVFITTSNKTNETNSPFSFGEKVIMMKAAGIPGNRISEEPEPYIPKNLFKKLDPAKWSVIFAVGEKDMGKNPRFQPGYKRNGEPTYFQYLGDKKPHELMGFEDHGYLTIAPIIKNNKGIVSGTKERQKFKQAYKKGPESVDALITKLYGPDAVGDQRLLKVLRKLKESSNIFENTPIETSFGILIREYRDDMPSQNNRGYMYFLNKKAIIWAAPDLDERGNVCNNKNNITWRIFTLSKTTDENKLITYMPKKEVKVLLLPKKTTSSDFSDFIDRDQYIDRVVQRIIKKIIKYKVGESSIGTYGKPKASKGVFKKGQDKKQGQGIGSPGKTASHGKSGQRGFVGDSLDPGLSESPIMPITIKKPMKKRHIVYNRYYSILKQMEDLVKELKQINDPLVIEQKQDLMMMMRIMRQKIQDNKSIKEGFLDRVQDTYDKIVNPKKFEPKTSHTKRVVKPLVAPKKKFWQGQTTGNLDLNKSNPNYRQTMGNYRDPRK